MTSKSRRRQRPDPGAETPEPVPTGGLQASEMPRVEIEIPSSDPLYAYLVSVARPVEVAELELQSPVVEEIRGAGIAMIVPLVGQGDLLGALYLGPRLSEQPYSSDDRRLLASLASQVAPAMQVAQLVREQQAEAKVRERIQQELEVAALIQHTLLPRELPQKPGWAVDAFYRPARSVGGDFYDFIDLPDGRLGVTIGDVTDKGVPAALVMATCRSMLRAAAGRHENPGEVLADVNETLVDEIPPAMFVTCLYAIIDPADGSMTIGNAGHNLPYIRTSDGVIELRATGMPLGLMPGMKYEETSYQFSNGDVMVLTSDGITEAHSPDGEMFGFARLLGRVGAPDPDEDMVSAVVSDVERHTGPDAEQEDDITLVVVRRTSSAAHSADAFDRHEGAGGSLTTFTVASEDGNERVAIDLVVAALDDVGLSQPRLERLKTAVGETVMNAMEHGNKYQPDLEVEIAVEVSPARVAVKVTDQGGRVMIQPAETPDIEAKLAGEQTPRGWGLFLIGEMVDEINQTTEGAKHTVELIVNREGAR